MTWIGMEWFDESTAYYLSNSRIHFTNLRLEAIVPTQIMQHKMHILKIEHILVLDLEGASAYTYHVSCT
uniref:Uncharacterized protein n=1 Tax=Arundo donax TaxID=35708 RepID=A0A0A9AP55_ARUDO